MPSQAPTRAAGDLRIALIHATALAIEPIRQAFARHWPDPVLMNLLDDSLSQDHARNGGILTAEMTRRFIDLAMYAKSTGADAILFTCSAFGPAIEKAAEVTGIPTLKPNEAMFEQALQLAADEKGALALIATFEPSLAPMCTEFAEMAEARGSPARLAPHHVPVAMASLAAGNAQLHHQLIADKAKSLDGAGLILLAQFSMAAAAEHVASQVADHCRAKVLTSPDCAALALKKMLLNTTTGPT